MTHEESHQELVDSDTVHVPVAQDRCLIILRDLEELENLSAVY